MQATALSAEIDRLAKDAKQILLAADFDGTLCPIAESPLTVVVPPAILEVLDQLSMSGRVAITVISGRALNDLMRRLPLPIILAGNHGLAVRSPFFTFEHAGARRARPQLANACLQLRHVIAGWKGAWVEDKILTAAVHYRNVLRAEHYTLMRAVRHCMAPYSELLRMHAGQKAIEIIPRVDWNKGSCLAWIRHKLNMEGHGCICIGDGQTDESMFAANADQLNISVGPFSHSMARYHAADVFEVASVLARLEQALWAHALEPHDPVLLLHKAGRL